LVSLNLYIKILTTFLLAVFCSVTQAQEICNDAIDNDLDGLIDLNDPDCECIVLTPQSLIPNPSFEDRDCCPDDEGMLDCADSWDQASGPTTDYLHTCGITGHPFLNVEAPQPFPDGEGCVGFRDGKPNSPQFKEYTGSCLTEIMVLNESYRMDFFVGFHTTAVNSSFTIALFGTDDCQNLPFGNDDNDFGCPSNSSNWDLIAELDVSGGNEWINVVFEFTADKEYAAIILGAGCEVNPEYREDPYFFMDKLTIAASNQFGENLVESGNICNGDFTMEVAPNDIGYQWYLDNVAILGQVSSIISLPSDASEGVYKVLIEKLEGCYLSAEYVLIHSSLESSINVDICEGDSIVFGTQMLDESGFYEETLLSEFGCDSITDITLKVFPHSSHSIVEYLCPNETFKFDSKEYTEAGNFEVLLVNQHGCDSVINVELIEVQGIEDLVLEDNYQVKLGDSLHIKPTSISQNAIRFEWCVGEEVIETNLDLSIQAIHHTEFVFKAYTEDDCEVRESVFISVDDDVDVYFPNVFTPDGINNNSYYFDIKDDTAKYINQFKIFDRWGQIMYSHNGEKEDIEGWDGYINMEKAHAGVYVFMTEIQFINDETKIFHGSFTLIR